MQRSCARHFTVFDSILCSGRVPDILLFLTAYMQRYYARHFTVFDSLLSGVIRAPGRCHHPLLKVLVAPLRGAACLERLGRRWRGVCIGARGIWLTARLDLSLT